jgi:hypothetical protein
MTPLDPVVAAEPPAPPRKSARPTNKWIAAEVAAVVTFLTALIQNHWQLSSELQVMLVGLVGQAILSYVWRNSDAPGGVPTK